jgi:hypothetical protein
MFISRFSEDGRKFCNKELHNLYSSTNVITDTKSRSKALPGSVARIGRRGMHVELQWGSQNGSYL